MTNREEILRAEHLSLWVAKDDGEVQIIEDASFAIRRGELWGIAGESGAGKSMLMRAVAALLPDRSTRMQGKILYRLADGTWQDLLEMPYDKRHGFVSERVAIIFQDSIHALNPNERILRQWGDTTKLHHPNVGKEECTEHLLRCMELFGIRGGMRTLRSYPHQLSGGMRQRIAIAMALESQSAVGEDASATRGGIIIADEPTTSLDSITQRSVIDYIATICEAGDKTLLYVSHNLGIMQYLCNNLMVLKGGRIVEQGRANDLFFSAKDPYIRELVRETLNVMGRNSGDSL